MKINKLSTVMRSLVAASALIGLTAFSTTAQAYHLKTVFKTEHFAVNQVVLDAGEELDAPTRSAITGDVQAKNRLEKLSQSSTVIFPEGSAGLTGKINTPGEELDAPTRSAITGDVQAKNRLEKLSQSSTVIFPEGSAGLTGKINTPILGVLTIANFDTGKDRIYFNNKVKYSTDAGVYVSFKQLLEMLNQNALRGYVPELKKLPVIFTDVQVTHVGVDPTINGFFVTSANEAFIMDLRIDDSVFYDKATRNTIRPGCTINVLTFIDRMIDNNFPLFISGRAALNYMDCSKAPAPQKAAAK